MIAKLASRNALRFLVKRAPLLFILSITLAAMFVGNTFLDMSRTALENAYSKSLSGDFSLSAQSQEGFSLFGSELPLIGEYSVIPSLPRAAEWRLKLEADPRIESVVGVVAASAVMEVFEYRTPISIFGVDFPDYLKAFPALKLTMGEVPRPGERAILINEELYQRIAKTRGVASPMNSIVSLIIFNDQTFTVRQAKISGVFRYAVSDDLLNRVVLADADTARSINGYTVGSSTEPTKASASGKSTGDLDALFDEGIADVDQSSVPGIDSGDVEAALSDHTVRDQLNQTLVGSWNFLLVHTADGRADEVAQHWTPEARASSVQVRSWQDTVGGVAGMVSLLSLAFNIGILIIALGSLVVVVNAIGLSVLERSREIGTMRALGASQQAVVLMIVVETLLFVVVSGTLGIVLGWMALVGVTLSGVVLTNPFLAALFGAGPLHPNPTLLAAIGHLAILVVAGLVGSLQPTLLALKISPARAMAAL